ncbi:MAG: hypothetical protein WB592_19890, partial [Acidimicrobiales bacterium]
VSPSWSPYKGDVIDVAITKHQHNLFSHNRYFGPWSFMYHDQSGVVHFSVWHGRDHQDLRSTISGS